MAETFSSSKTARFYPQTVNKDTFFKVKKNNEWNESEKHGVALRLIGSGYSDRAEILGLIIDFFLLRTLRNLYKNEIRRDTEIGQNIIIFSILDKSRSVAPVKREIKLVSPYQKK